MKTGRGNRHVFSARVTFFVEQERIPLTWYPPLNWLCSKDVLDLRAAQKNSDPIALCAPKQGYPSPEFPRFNALLGAPSRIFRVATVQKIHGDTFEKGQWRSRSKKLQPATTWARIKDSAPKVTPTPLSHETLCGY